MNAVKVTKQDHIGIVTIDNPPLNVLGSFVFQELGEAFKNLAEDEEVLVVILTGKGSKAFVAGADIKEFPQLIGNSDMNKVVMDTHAVLNQIEDFPKPTIAVLNGMAFGGGCELALTCDIRIAEEHVQIGLPEVKLGIFPGGGGTQRLPRLIGTSRAKELMFTGDPIGSEKAERIGLVNDVVESGKGMEAGLALAKRIAGNSLQSTSRIKSAVNRGVQLPFIEGIQYEALLFEEIFKTEDVKEGIAAFIEKRKPQYSNR
ncbi:enoyl-CoA hydratase/isomerase family protein [Pseudalkalibacillus caeni]|uniref:Enoyl-CoA hydratase n=1 Tax=Exobacillus caeni TaxID=2574798 RepID=A0A5R9F5I0_9BACL|nr:enoyl-CoA hydratase [Pseudalkalibacillus caeni]TLS38291.1 enoyl-CoA hydratase [Pseudalkalibacillus caeni]